MKIIIVPCSFDNYSYIVTCEETGKGAIVDPTEAYPVLVECEKNGVEVDSVLCTHHHNDHIGEIPEILGEYKDIKVYCHLSDAKRIGSANSYVEHGDMISVGNLHGEILYTPGHTMGSICYKFENSLLTGDTLFGAGCGRLFEGSPEQMLTSLMLLMKSCNDDTQIYFGHEYTAKNLEFDLEIEPANVDARERLQSLQSGNACSTPSSLKLEKKTNPFLRVSEPMVMEGLKMRGITHDDTPLDVFTQLRLLRNSF